MSFIRDGLVNFAMIVSTQYQKRGIGKTLIEKAKQEHDCLYGWVVTGSDYVKLNGQAYNSPMAFYRKNEFEVIENETFETPQLKTVRIKWCENFSPI